VEAGVNKPRSNMHGKAKSTEGTPSHNRCSHIIRHVYDLLSLRKTELARSKVNTARTDDVSLTMRKNINIVNTDRL